jgi:hypothetical protein
VRRRRAVLRAAAAGLGLAVATGCAGAPSKQTTVLAGSAARSLLILPLNVAVVMPRGLQERSPAVWHALEVYLRRDDRKLRTVSYEVARKFWLECIEQSRAKKGAKAGYDDAARLLVLRLAKYADFDTVIAPTLYVREAHIQGRTATWDGIERPVEVEASASVAREVADVPLEGSAPAASLHAVVFDAKGNKIQEGRGGLELLVSVHVRRSAVSLAPEFEFEPRTDFFEDAAHLQEGIAKALSPFLLPPR